MSTKGESNLVEKLFLAAGLREQLLVFDEKRSDDEHDTDEPPLYPTEFDPAPQSESPLDHTGPIPPEYQRDPYAVEVFAMLQESASVASKPRLQIQERVLWASIVAVSWSITIVAILKVLGIL